MLNFIFMLLIIMTSSVSFADINIYGPGGPNTALSPAIKLFTEKTGIQVHLVYGPEAKWIEQAKQNADFIYGASEQSALSIINNLPNRFNYKESVSLYYHDTIILVQKGNPKNIKSLQSLAGKNINVVVVEGAGKSNTSGTAVWEDLIGRMKDINILQSIKSNIVFYAPNSGSAVKMFTDPDAKIDAFITWTDWAVSFPEIGDAIKISPDLVISRSFNIVPSKNITEEAKVFLHFLQNDEPTNKIFQSYGWYKKH